MRGDKPLGLGYVVPQLTGVADDSGVVLPALSPSELFRTPTSFGGGFPMDLTQCLEQKKNVPTNRLSEVSKLLVTFCANFFQYIYIFPQE